MSNVRYSAAKTSKVTKKTTGIPSIKKMQQDLKKILPSNKQYMKNLKSKDLKSKDLTKSEVKNEGLIVSDYNVELDYQLGTRDDIIVAVDTIINNQWSESTSLHDRYTVAEGDMETQIFLLSGLSAKFKADIIKYRLNWANLITINQLYTIFQSQGNTFVDKNLEIKIRQGQLRKFVITNAAPVISRSLQKYQNGKTTYGFENVEIICKTEDYNQSIKLKQQKILTELEDPALSSSEKQMKQLQLQSLDKFYQFIQENPTKLFVQVNENLTFEHLSQLLTFGYVTLTSNHLQEIESHQYSISYPGCGSFLKLINHGRVWLVKYLTKAKNQQILESKIFDNWEGVNLQGQSKMNNFRTPFYGYDLNWILADSLGAGIVDVFNTPVGRGWKLTGKV